MEHKKHEPTKHKVQEVTKKEESKQAETQTAKADKPEPVAAKQEEKPQVKESKPASSSKSALKDAYEVLIKAAAKKKMHDVVGYLQQARYHHIENPANKDED